MDITFKLNGVDWSGRLSNYHVTKEIKYSRVVTTLDNVEHSASPATRYVIDFAFIPLTDDEGEALFDALDEWQIMVEFTSHYEGDLVKTMRLTSDLSSAYGMRSINGKRYYKGDALQLRQV